MHIKHIHETIECLAEYGKELVKAGTGSEEVNLEATSKIIDMIKDLSEAEYYARISKAMEEAEKEDEEEAKRIMREMKEEYGDEEGERRFYDNYRYKRTGRFAPKGRGSYVGRRGYEEPPYYRMSPEMYKEHDPEWYRDMDRQSMNRLYYTDTGMSGGSSGNMGGSRANSGNSGNSDGNTRSYTEGYDDGQRRGYSEGYERGRNEGSRNNSSRYDNARRNYTETKQMHRGTSQEDNSENMRSLEKLLNIIGEDVKEYMPTMSTSEKAMAKQKIEAMAKSIQ